MVSNTTGAKNDLKYVNLSVTNTSFRMNTRIKLVPEVLQFKVFPSNGEITSFSNLQLISSTGIGGVEGRGENVKLFSTVTVLNIFLPGL